MRKAHLAALAIAFLPAAPLLAQTPNVEVRVDRLEKEMKAVQRKVFPGGAGQFLEPEMTQQQAPVPTPGTPASSPVTDLIARVDAVESQMASLTGQVEQNGYKLRQLEEAFAKYKAETDAKLSAGATPGTADGGADAAPSPAAPVRSVPARSAASGPPPAVPTTKAGAAASEARKTAVAAVERPRSNDAVEDEYLYGYRLWEAKFYPEAETQLKSFLDKYPSHKRASYAQNLLGRAYLDEGKPALASVAFYENYQKRPKSERAPDSLAYLGDALIQLKKPKDACKVYQELEDVYGATLSASLKAMMVKGRVTAKCGA